MVELAIDKPNAPLATRQRPGGPTPIGRCSLTRTIPLTRGFVVLVDDEDYAQLAVYQWYAHVWRDKVYAARKTLISEGVARNKKHRELIKMHREVMGLASEDPRMVDHVDGDGLNNTRRNLRLATATQNQGNRSRRQGGTSKFKGVYWSKANNKWRAQIGCNGKQSYIGLFIDEVEAARAYDAAATAYFDAFARLNFPDNEEGANVEGR